MAAKPRKSISSWVTCATCECIVAQKDVDQHQTDCPPNTDSFKYNYIHANVLHSSIEVYKQQDALKNISDREMNEMVFLSQSALQFLEISIGDSVILSTKDSTVIRTAWPTGDKTLLSVSLTRNAMELNNLQGSVTVRKLLSTPKVAKEIVIVNAGKQSLNETMTELDILLKNLNELKLFCIGNKISIPFYGKKLTFKIVDAIADNRDHTLSDELGKLNLNANALPEVNIYKVLYSTKWTIRNDAKKEEKSKTSKKRSKIEELGGYDDLITDVKDVLDIGLGKCKTIGDFTVSKGVLLYGAAGVGKSMIASALIAKYEVETFLIHSSDIYCKSIGETEKRLKDIFAEARKNAPSIILIEDIDSLCPRRSNSSTDHERRVLAQLVALFDDVQSTNDYVVILATTSKLDFVDPSLRRPGRIDKEFEVSVPTPKMRTDILTKLLSKIPNTLNAQDVADISFITHGFVGADLYGLCSQAVINAVKRQKNADSLEDSTKITMNDFNLALTVTKPSAMKEVLVEVPNVQWSDIGGQNDLKLKLKQAVEWPLRHPEAFLRMGITPPRGVLMFGPPGCSKTMIAKALATESKVNFLNIKGPELFSKWVGESEKAVREVFRKARQVAPSIVFIDEIDALGGERGSSSASNGSNVQERVLAQLLTELDGVTALGNVTLVAATNRPDKIDKALLRPGRLDRIIYVRLPDYETRQEIFDIKLRNMPIAADVNTQDLVDLTEGYTGAEIQAICHEAAMKALEENLSANIITKEHFKAALSAVTPRTPPTLIALYDDYINKIF